MTPRPNRVNAAFGAAQGPLASAPNLRLRRTRAAGLLRFFSGDRAPVVSIMRAPLNRIPFGGKALQILRSSWFKL